MIGQNEGQLYNLGKVQDLPFHRITDENRESWTDFETDPQINCQNVRGSPRFLLRIPSQGRQPTTRKFGVQQKATKQQELTTTKVPPSVMRNPRCQAHSASDFGDKQTLFLKHATTCFAQLMIRPVLRLHRPTDGNSESSKEFESLHL